MELWIRSQDKTTLMKVNRIGFERNIDDEPTIYGYENYGNYERLGTYKTKERALEVLSDIHDRLAILETMRIMGVTEFNVQVWNKLVEKTQIHTVYQMPEE